MNLSPGVQQAGAKRCKMSNNATLKKISDHLHVSISTVSRALKDHPDVSPETKRRVKELAEFLDYEPNAFAVNLRTRHSNLFAVIVPEISNYFYHSFIQAVEEEARKMGYTLMILQSMNDPEIEQQNLRLCRHNKVAGVFVALSSKTKDFEPFQKMERLSIPVVFFDKVPMDDVFNKVCLADEEAGIMAAQQLLAHHPKRILAVMGSKDLSITQRRQKAFETYCRQHQPEIQVQVVFADNMDHAFTLINHALLHKDRPDAIFSMSDEIMCGAIKAINRQNLHMPGDIRLITVSNGFLPLLFSPEIAYVKTSGYDLGKLSFERMREIMDGKKFVRENLLSCTFHPGGSL